MIQIGVSLPECVRPESDDQVRRAVARFAEQAGAQPAYVGLWRSGRGHGREQEHKGPPSSALVESLRKDGTEPFVSFETAETRDGWLVEARDTVAGLRDGDLAAWTDPTLWIRINQEPNSERHFFPWAGDERLYVEYWQYLRDKMQGRFVWCPILGSKVNLQSMAGYYPGDEYVDAVAFDRYTRKQPARALPGVWDEPIAALNALAPGKTVFVPETGSDVMLPELARERQWASVAAVQGVAAVLYTDIDVPGSQDDWTMSKRMVKQTGGMIRAGL